MLPVKPKKSKISVKASKKRLKLKSDPESVLRRKEYAKEMARDPKKKRLRKIYNHLYYILHKDQIAKKRAATWEKRKSELTKRRKLLAEKNKSRRAA